MYKILRLKILFKYLILQAAYEANNTVVPSAVKFLWVLFFSHKTAASPNITQTAQ